MHANFGPRGRLEINNAHIIYRNFAGEGSKYNREGDRNFAVRIPNQEIADALIEEGWNIRIKPPREDGDEPFMYLPVKVKYYEDDRGNKRGPNAYLISGNSRTELDEETIACVDDLDIRSVDLDIRPYDWEINGKSGRAAYLHAIEVTQEIDRFAARYNANNDNY